MKNSIIPFIIMATLLFNIPADAQDNQLTKPEKKEGWQLLFDGKTTIGWKGTFKD